jgi:hypothetical protein
LRWWDKPKQATTLRTEEILDDLQVDNFEDRAPIYLRKTQMIEGIIGELNEKRAAVDITRLQEVE